MICVNSQRLFGWARNCYGTRWFIKSPLLKLIPSQLNPVHIRTVYYIFSQSVSQSVSRSVSQSVSQPANQSVGRFICLSERPCNYADSQPVSNSITHSVDYLVTS